MDIYEEWRIFDPKDPRTQPEGLSEIWAEFDNGKTIRGNYSRELGTFSHAAAISNAQDLSKFVVGESKIKRWQYARPGDLYGK